MKRAFAVVYQAGIANVFEVIEKKGEFVNRKRVIQGTFGQCEQFARGLKYAGFRVVSMSCNMAGDITWADWSTDLNDAPFYSSMSPVFTHNI